MACNIATIFDQKQRIELVKNRMAYEADPEAFAASCKAETDELKAKISAAQKILPDVTMDRDLALKISGVCALVDVVLDSAAGGWNTVEREGISITHPAKFIMIGSGNPEEGELRP